MRLALSALAFALLAFASVSAAPARPRPGRPAPLATPTRAATAAGATQVFTPENMKWVQGPASLPRVIRICVLEGNPTRSGPYTLRLWLPANTRIDPYWRSGPERLTVMIGGIWIGLGDRYSENAGPPIRAGSFAVIPARLHHFIWTRDPTVLQLSGSGPWDLFYVNPLDDPRRAPLQSSRP